MEGLGINPILLLAQIVNFTILLLVLKKFLYGPLLKNLDERKKTAAETLLNSQKVKEELEETRKSREEIMSAARDEAKKTADAAKRAAEMSGRGIIEEARIRAQKEAEKGVERIKIAEVEASGRLNEVARDLAMSLAEKILQEKFRDPKVRERYLTREVSG